MTDLSPVHNRLDIDSQNASGRPNEGKSDSKMVADQSGRGARRSRREDSAARIPTGQAELEQQHHELLEEAHESAVRETQKSELRKRQEVGRRD